MVVKENQPGLRALLVLLLDSPVACRVEQRRARERDAGHGRIERRELVSSGVLSGSKAWPGVQQIFRLERERVEKKTGKREVEVIYGLTSLSEREAGPKKLLGMNRGHWGIENRSHHVRDVTYAEDQSQVRNGTVAQVLATIRNVAIGLMRLCGKENIAAATRYYAARPGEALALLGIATDF
jgi:predicted transposase YbfD/YdcC